MNEWASMIGRTQGSTPYVNEHMPMRMYIRTVCQDATRALLGTDMV